MTWWIGDLELSHSNGIYLTKAPNFPANSRGDSRLNSNGLTIDHVNIKNKPIMVTFAGWCDSLDHYRQIAQYDSHIYNWDDDNEDLYLIDNLTRQWKIQNLSLKTIADRGSLYNFRMTISLNNIGHFPIIHF